MGPNHRVLTLGVLGTAELFGSHASMVGKCVKGAGLRRNRCAEAPDERFEFAAAGVEFVGVG